MRDTPKDLHKKLLGLKGENQAVKFLKKAGYKILERNFKTRVGEIDVIAKDKDFIVFVEVKTRTGEVFGTPAEAVNRKKREKYFKVAQEYLIKNYAAIDVLSRFDVVEVEEGKINHIINAFFV